jgi:alpha-beta hydrolase superfamily lysophospholipase
MNLRRGLVLGVLVATLASAVGIATAGPAYHLSDNPPTGAPKRGVVITVHGGGWKNYGAAADDLMSLYIDSYTGWGFRVYNLGHRARRKSLVDMLDAVERVSRKNPDRPLCLFGGSSGADLVLIAAAELPKLIDCVIAQGPIPDLVKPDPERDAWQIVHQLAVQVWGRRIHEVNPMERAREIRDPVLLIAPECDVVVSVGRQQKFVSKLRRGTLLVQQAAAPGEGYDTGHCPLTWESVYEGFQAQRDFLERYAG